MRIAPLVLIAILIGCSGNKPAAGGGDAATSQPVANNKPPRDDKAKNAQLNRWLTEVQVDIPPTTYRVQPPDAIRIMAPAIKELDKSEVRLRPDGKVSLNLLGDVYVAGMTPPEIAQDIIKRLEKFYVKESIYVSVDVSDFQSKKYYVFGQVNSPGVKPYTGRDTVMKVLAEAQLNELAWPQKVVLVRPHEDANVRQKVTIDLKEMYTNGSTAQNYLVEEGDVLYIPPSPLAELGLVFEKLLTPIRPITDVAIFAFTGL